MQKAIALALLLSFPAFEQEGMAGGRAGAHLLETALSAPVLVAPGQLVLVPSPRLLAAAPPPAGEECTEECDPLYYDPATGSDCIQVCGEASEDAAEAEEAQEEAPQVVQAVQPPSQDNSTVWILVALGLALAIGISSLLVATQCDPSSGKPCP